MTEVLCVCVCVVGGGGLWNGPVYILEGLFLLSWGHQTRGGEGEGREIGRRLKNDGGTAPGGG